MSEYNNIIISIKNGDKLSFKELFDDYYPMLCVFAEKYHSNPAICKDVSQEAFMKYWGKQGKFFRDYTGQVIFIYYSKE